MTNYFLRNQQNDRLELHFDRDFYFGLSEPIKQSVRASFFFNKSIPAWLSKTKLSENPDVAVPDYLDLDDYGTASDTNEPGPRERQPRAERSERVTRVQTAVLPLNQHLKAAALIANYEAEDGRVRRTVSAFQNDKGDLLIKVVGPRSAFGDASQDDYTRWFSVTKAGKVDSVSADGMGLTPVVVSNRVKVPDAKRKPHYSLDKYTSQREHLRADVLEIEVLLQKMEVNQRQRFDGMTDGYDRLPDNWKLMPLGVDFSSWHRKPYHYAANLVSWGDYELRYTGKLGAAVIVFPRRDTAGSTRTEKPVDQAKLGQAFFKTADSLQAESDKKNRELETALNNTPKRLREYNTKQIEADIALDKSKYYRAIGQARIEGTLPAILAGISPIKAENHVYLFIAGYATGGGYYEAYRANEPRYIADYKNSNQAMLKSADKIGLRTLADVELAYQALQTLTGNGVKQDTQKQQLNKLIDKWRFTNQAGFFPTPPDLANQLIEEAVIEPGNTILEPSAGLGDIAELIRQQYPNNSLEVGETMHSLREILQLKGFNVTGDDFLNVTKSYDRIIMNPPFENGQDIQHVYHAFSLLKPGGRVVAIMGEGAFLGNQRKSGDFIAWLNSVDGLIKKLPPGSFKSAFRSTGVNTRWVVIDKPSGPQIRSTSQEQAKAKLKLLSLKLRLLNL